MDIRKATLHSLADALKNKEFSAIELCQEYLKQIDARDGEIGAFLEIDRENMLNAARASDERRAAGAVLSDFDGLPIAVKDNIAVKGERCSCASKLLEPVKSPYDATAVSGLKKQGFIPFGRLNMDEFAMGSSCENSAFKRTANPLDTSRVPGGSSGGSAACVAADFAPAALGSDTGGSIRQPAAFCGVVGVKPTYGRVSRYGLVAFASSLDQIGPLCNDAEDAGIILDAISGADPHDSTTLPAAVGNYAAAAREGAASGSLAGLKFGLPKEYFTSGMDSAVAKVMDETIAKVKALGGEIVDVSLPHTKYAVAVYYIIATAEASANLARFDGIRYGARKEGNGLVDTYYKSRGAGFGDEVKRRILLGTYVLSSGYYDAYYLRAQRVRTLIRKDFEDAFTKCDLLLTPVSPGVAFKFNEKSDPLQMYLSDIFTIALNLSGHCGISIPAGIDPASNMPIAAQIMAPALGEASMLKAAAAFMRA
ncbi:MAG: Asp-tRNA(Asn)/Glu-tRNA(Gln) amidotransferase subunit GatA [Lentisphaerae bacterium]|nr:Asp-tRNA(Asn)/Glu-tRNA(Gln) amidotransferase subunit GatA [Lentisphaerota bacterium]